MISAPLAGVTDRTADDDQFVPARRAVAGWVLYDLANTIFSLNILSLYFSLWVVDDQGGRDAHFTIATSLSMAVMFGLAPLLGALSDAVPRRMPLLVVTTICCCAVTALLGSGGLWVSLGFFVVANIAYQSGLLLYDTLLPSVSTEQNRGRIGSIGVGVGYFGSLVGIAIGAIVLALNDDGDVWIFRATAIAFLIFAIPCFLFVRERPRNAALAALPSLRSRIHLSIARSRDAFQALRGYPQLRRFLIGHALYADAANTAIAVMGIYATREMGFSSQQAQVVLLLGIVGAISGAIVIGRFVDRLGPRRTLLRVLVLWMVALGAFALIPWLDLPDVLFWPSAFVAGIALGGLWTADRPFMLRLTPPERLGQFYGLYSMVGRFAAITGPLIWALIVDGLGWGRPVAVASLILVIVAAFRVVMDIDDHQRRDLELRAHVQAPQV